MATSQEDGEQLQLLSIANYVFAGISALLSLFPIAQLMLGVGLFTLAKDCKGNDCPPEWIGAVAIAISLLFILSGLTDALLSFLKARFLARRQNYRYCLIASYIQCLFFPFGTVLGILALMILKRESIKKLF